MKMKSIIALLVALVFTFCMVGLTFAAEKEVTGTVMKVEAKSIMVKDAAGKVTKVDVSNSKDVKVGEKVIVKEGKCMKEMAPAPAKKKKSSGY